ncbi:hypothetical protein ACF068_29010 [Streptomyces sp. NPDC016309]|uniref:hypothetical protein n=1 Tax=Streptomyces sp. NPDC016309 TaxID=3364965 RepID=UPI0036FED0EE
MPRPAPFSLLLAAPPGFALTARGTVDAGKTAAAKPRAKETAPAGVTHQHTVLEARIAADGGEAKVGEYRGGCIAEAAEPWFQAERGGQGEHSGHGKLVNREPTKDETRHIEVIPMEAATGRIVPGVPIRLEVVDAQGQVAQARGLNFYHAEFFHNANDFSIPTAGKYALRATLQPSAFLWRGASGEKPAPSESVTATFANVELKPES